MPKLSIPKPPDPRPSKAHPEHRARRKELEKKHGGYEWVPYLGLALTGLVLAFDVEKDVEKKEKRKEGREQSERGSRDGRDRDGDRDRDGSRRRGRRGESSRPDGEERSRGGGNRRNRHRSLDRDYERDRYRFLDEEDREERFEGAPRDAWYYGSGSGSRGRGYEDWEGRRSARRDGQ